MAKYIKCDCCGKRINFCNEVYNFEDRAGLYCSSDCFANTYGGTYILNDELADDCFCTVYDDETRKEEIQKEMEEHKMALDRLYREFAELTTQN